MGTRAYWLSNSWRYRLVEEDAGWTYAETLADIKEDVDGAPTLVQKRTGRKREGYVYEDHSVINQSKEAKR